MHDFSMLAKNRGETRSVGQRTGDAVYLTANETLRHTGLHQQLRRGMHRVAYVAGTVDGGYLLRLFGGAHLDDGLDERQRGGLLLLRRMDAQQVHDLYLRVMSVRRQEMHCPVCRN